MQLASIAALLLALFVAQSVYRHWTNPLRKIPTAHPLAPFTSLWINYVRWRSVENATLRWAHEQRGPVIRLGPNEVSVNCVKGGIREIYAGGFEKANLPETFNWYAFFTNYGVHNMFSTGRNKAHSARKRMLSNVYSKSVVTASPALAAQVSTIMYQRLLPALASAFSNQDPGVFNIGPLLNAATMDIVSGYVFGLKSSSNLIDDPHQLAWFLDLYNSRRSFNFWPQELPKLNGFLKTWFGYRLVPQWVDEANKAFEGWTREMCDGAAKVITQGGTAVIADTPVVYEQLSVSLDREAKKTGQDGQDRGLLAASEVLDQIAAGFDTSGITLTYVVHELSRNAQRQARLQQELRTLSPAILPSSSPVLPEGKAVDALPFLHAVIWETLRLHPAIPGPQPRVSPSQGCHLGTDKMYYVPGGVRVSASAGLLHLNEKVYPQASEWIPERWLGLDLLDEEKRRDMESRWFWAFGSGGRMCVGSHLAVYQMKYIVAAIYSNYTTIIMDDTGIEQSDAYTAPPKSSGLRIRLQRLNH